MYGRPTLEAKAEAGPGALGGRGGFHRGPETRWLGQALLVGTTALQKRGKQPRPGGTQAETTATATSE